MPRPEPRQHARDAAAAIRELNHTTLSLESMPYAGEVSATVLALIELVDRLPQALDQLEAGLLSLERRGQIRLDHDADLRGEVAAAVKGLRDARTGLGGVSKALGEASAPLFHMGAPYVADEGDED